MLGKIEHGEIKNSFKVFGICIFTQFCIGYHGFFSGIYAERSGLSEEWLENSQVAIVFMLISQITLPIFLMFQYKSRKMILEL